MNKYQRFLLDNNMDDICINHKFPDGTRKNPHNLIYVSDVLDKFDNQPKRNPLPDGTLPLTDEELREFAKLIGLNSKLYDIEYVSLANDGITIARSNNGIHCDFIFTASVKAIFWLNERFNLGGDR